MDAANHDTLLNFPTVGDTLLVNDTLSPPTQYLPFRRISMPSSRSLLQRPPSMASVTSSFDVPYGSPFPTTTPPTTPTKPGFGRQPSLESRRRHNGRQSTLTIVVDEEREGKRRKVINEIYETERTYVDGLELIYSHFLTPIIASLDTPNQLLSREELTSVFSNFIDIWNLHRSFFSSLSSILSVGSSTSAERHPPPISPTLLSHFPYLSLYTPFVSSFADAMASYTALQTKHSSFSSFIATQESDPQCGKLKFRDWLLTIVQRCPRYVLLLRDLIAATSKDDPDFKPLVASYDIVTKITESLNTSLHTHAQTLQLLGIQRGTPNLPFQLISPGRTLLKRGFLIQLTGSTPKDREFILFTDRLVWFASVDRHDDDVKRLDMLRESTSSPNGRARPRLTRSRSKSDADLPRLAARKMMDSALKSRLAGPKRTPKKAANGEGERWLYKGHLDLVDLDVVMGPPGESKELHRLEILSPLKSFALYAPTEEERDQWGAAIRNAKDSLLVSLNVMNPNLTLTSSSSTNHLRQALQALPYLPEEQDAKPKRGRVDHFVPAVWIPDSKTDSCMRCGRTFGWRRRRHHCRLCGRCICASCSSKTFFIFDTGKQAAKNSHQSARACDACYDTVFPLLESTPQIAPPPGTVAHLTLSGLKSVPSLSLDDNPHLRSSALMAIDVPPSRRHRGFDMSPIATSRELSESSSNAYTAVRVKHAVRPRSYVHVLEDFQAHSEHERSENGSFIGSEEVPSVAPSAAIQDDEQQRVPSSPTTAISQASAIPRSPVTHRNDTARRRKRFSVPAMAIHTRPVTAHANILGEGKAKRWSLVLGTMKGQNDNNNDSSVNEGVVMSKLRELLGR